MNNVTDYCLKKQTLAVNGEKASPFFTILICSKFQERNTTANLIKDTK